MKTLPRNALAAVARRTVGKLALKDAIDVVRATMISEAVARASGNRSAAAIELGMTSQGVSKAMLQAKPKRRK